MELLQTVMTYGLHGDTVDDYSGSYTFALILCEQPAGSHKASNSTPHERSFSWVDEQGNITLFSY